jgi:hypothetical protein
MIRRVVALVIALAAFVGIIYSFEGPFEWGRSIPLITLPLYQFMSLSPWTYGLTELTLGLLAAWLAWRWVTWWFHAMDAERAARRQ